MVAIRSLTGQVAVLALSVQALASPASGMHKRTLDTCSSNTKGKCPGTLNCSAAKVSTAIQAAECSHNTRTSGAQTFAVFETDHQYDGSHGAPYGTCSAYTCAAPTAGDMTDADDDCWTFFWAGQGESNGTGTGCIRSPDDGTCGCEDSDGTFVYGSDSCT
ncbi:small secreted protein [Xylariaceae sp. FL0804]|nr:small secreted protein [Xylariaceae sp. FL0804]